MSSGIYDEIDVNPQPRRADTTAVRARARERGEDTLYAPAVARVAVVAAASALALVLPRTGPVHWRAVPFAVALLSLAGAVAWWRDLREAEAAPVRSLGVAAHVLLAHLGAGFAGVAVGGVEGNQRFLLLALVVVTAASASSRLAAFAWASATVTVWWSAVLAGTPDQ